MQTYPLGNEPEQSAVAVASSEQTPPGEQQNCDEIPLVACTQARVESVLLGSPLVHVYAVTLALTTVEQSTELVWVQGAAVVQQKLVAPLRPGTPAPHVNAVLPCCGVSEPAQEYPIELDAQDAEELTAQVAVGVTTQQ